MKIIFDYNRTIFDPDAGSLFPGVLELLEKLSARHRLFLVSRNEPGRKKGMEKFGLERYFREITFVDDKTRSAFSGIAGETEKVVVVGDSLSDEIRIGNQLGFITVRLKRGRFAGDIPRTPEEEPKFEILDIRELENIISSI